MKRLRVAFFGSPAFAVPTLERLHEEHDVVLVVTQPDAPAGRGMQVRAPAVAQRARELGLRVEQPTRLRRNADFHATLEALQLDVAITAAYGKLLPGDLLGVPTHGFLNAHASLLPALRGAAPIQWALIRGHEVTGITVMQTEVGLDTGPIRLVAPLTIEPEDTAATLSERLSQLAADSIAAALTKLAAGTLPSVPQDDAAATLAPLLTKEDGHVSWSDDATAIVNRWRGVASWPGLRFLHDGARVRVDQCAPSPLPAGKANPGTIVALDEQGVHVATGSGCICLRAVTPAGKRSMSARDWANGAHLKEGTSLA